MNAKLMNDTKEELSRMVEVCWNASHEAELTGYPCSIIYAPGQVDLVRFEVFKVLLACLCPKAPQHVDHGQLGPKEPWEE